MKKKIPIFKTDEEAERFVETADLTEYDLSQFKPVRFEHLAQASNANSPARCCSNQLADLIERMFVVTTATTTVV